MSIEFSGAGFHDPRNSCVHFRVLNDGQLFECAVKDEGLKSLCNDSGEAMEIFHSCRMFILRCIWGIINFEQNCLSDRVWIENLATCSAHETRRDRCNT
jgi:hypothetical protein